MDKFHLQGNILESLENKLEEWKEYSESNATQVSEIKNKEYIIDDKIVKIEETDNIEKELKQSENQEDELFKKFEKISIKIYHELKKEINNKSTSDLLKFLTRNKGNTGKIIFTHHTKKTLKLLFDFISSKNFFEFNIFQDACDILSLAKLDRDYVDIFQQILNYNEEDIYNKIKYIEETLEECINLQLKNKKRSKNKKIAERYKKKFNDNIHVKEDVENAKIIQADEAYNCNKFYLPKENHIRIFNQKKNKFVNNTKIKNFRENFKFNECNFQDPVWFDRSQCFFNEKIDIYNNHEAFSFLNMIIKTETLKRSENVLNTLRSIN